MARKPTISKEKTKKPAPAKVERPKRVIPKKPAAISASAPKSKVPRKKSKPVAQSKKKSKKPERKSKPTYERMIIKALKELGTRTFHSAVAIGKYVEANYPVPEDSYKRSLRLALKKAVDDGTLLQHKASYRVSAAASKASTSRLVKPTSSTDSKNKRKRASTDKEEPKRRTTSNSLRTASSIPDKKSSSKASSKASSKKSSAPSTLKKARKSSSKNSNSSETSTSIINTPIKPSGLKGDFIWQYEDKGWKNYDVEASNTVEEVYQGYLANRGDTDVRAVHSGSWEYQVDFMAMKQTNIQHDNHTVRNIRRVAVAKS